MQNDKPDCGWQHFISGSLKRKSSHRRRGFTLVFYLLCLMGSPQVRAELIEDLTLLSPKAMGLANAVTADPPGIDSIHFNPAGLVNIKRSSSEIKVATFSMANRYRTGDQRVDPQTAALYESLAGEPYPSDPLANQRGQTGNAVLLLPGSVSEEMELPVAVMGGLAIRPADADVVFATAGYSPMMVGVTRENTDVGRYDGKEVAITRITYFSPSVGYRIDDEWAIGTSLGFSYQGLSLTTDLRSPQTVAALIPVVGRRLTGTGFSLGPYDNIATLSTTMEEYFSMNINLGVLWSPTPWLSLGSCYRSETHSEMEGEFEMKYSDRFLELSGAMAGKVPKIGGESVERGSSRMEFVTPQHLALGMSVKITPRWKVNVDIQESFYKKWDEFKVYLDQDVDFLVIGSLFDKDAQARSISLQRNYQNAVSWSIGTEFQLTEKSLFRMGYQRRNSAIPENSLDLALPLADATFYGLGMEFDLQDNTNLQVSAGYLTSTYKIDYGQSENANSVDPFNLIYNPYVFLSLESKTSTALLAFSYTKPF